MRAPFYRSSASSRSRTLAGWTGLSLLVPLLATHPALAQGLHTRWATDAAAPDAPVAPLTHPAPPAATPLAELPTTQAWKDAHHAVGQFPRGHADIVAWEKQKQQPEPQGAGAPGANAGHTHQHPAGHPHHGQGHRSTP